MAKTVFPLNVNMTLHGRRHINNVLDQSKTEFSTKQTVQSTLCEKYYKNSGNLKAHNQTVHAGQKVWKCKICPRQFVRFHDLQYHELRTHGESSVSMKCVQCRKLVRNGKSDAGTDCQMCIHTRQTFFSSCSPGKEREFLYSKLKRKAFTCDVCGTVTQNLVQHRRSRCSLSPCESKTESSKKVKLQCTICGMETTNMAQHRRRHINNVLDQSKTEFSTKQTVQSTLCEKYYKNSGNLKAHNQTVHAGQKVWKCKICPRQFVRFHDLQYHELRTHGESSVSMKCFQCRKLVRNGKSDAGTDCQMCIHTRQTFFSSCSPGKEREFLYSKLKRKAFTCDVCGTVTQNLVKHRRSHTSLSPCESKTESSKKVKLQCTICGMEATNMARHRRRHINNFQDQLKTESSMTRTVQCTICEKHYRTRGFLKEHILTVHVGRRVWKCKICLKRFLHFHDLQRHELRTHGENNVSIKCFECRKLVRSGKSDVGADCQMCIHTRQTFFSSCPPGEERQFLYNKLKRKALTCDVCGIVTKYLAQHRRRHANIYPHQCSLCDRRFKDKQLLKSHLISHSTVCKYKCDVCLKPFKRLAGLTKHMYIHTGLRTYKKCKMCWRTYLGPFETHFEKFHVGQDVRRHKCVVCDKAFPRPYLLKNHMNIHTGRRSYLCEICGKTFISYDHLAGHQLSHKEKVPCSLCGKPFLKTVLSVHMKFHSDERPHQCEICGKGFKIHHNLQTHLKSHSNERPHACDKCDSSFKLPHQLRAHKKRHNKVAE